MRTKQQSSQRRVRCASTLFTLAAIILFDCSQKALAQQWNTNGNDISSANTGNVGVGTTSPGSKLDVNGRIRQTGSATDAGYLLTNSSLFASTTALNPGIAFYGGNGFNALYGADLGYNSATGRFRTRVFSGNELADVAFGRQQGVQSNPTQSAFIEFLTVRGDTGNVGIGTASPLAQIHVQGATDVLVGRFENTNSTGYTEVQVRNNGGTNFDRIQFGIGGTATGNIYQNKGYLLASSSIDGLILQAAKPSGIVQVLTGGSTERMRIDASGNVGIGTTTPAYKLDVNGEINATGLRINGTPISTGGGGPVTWAQVDKSTSSLADIQTRSAGDLNSGTIPIGRIGLSGNAGASTFLRGDNTWGPVPNSPWTSGTNNISYNSGNVGIASTNPLGQLHLGYTAQVAAPKTWTASSSNGRGLVIDSYQENAAPFKQFVDFAAMGDQNATQGGSVIRFLTNPVNSYTLAERMRIDNAGNVGIGATTPAYKLDVAGVINSSTGGFRFPDGSVQITAASNGTGSTAFSGVTAGTNTVALVVGSGGSLGVSGSGTINATTLGGATFAAPGAIGGTTPGSGAFSAVGINTAPSSYKLDVNGNTNVTGNINVTGSINAKYQDVAEWVLATHALPAGTVVTLDPTKSNHVEASSQAYDTRVAGVISAQPGIALGEPGDNKVLVATTGRVRLTVDATKGPIQIGDLLVTSDIPGVAMKSQPVNLGGIQLHRPGTLIGKALEPLAKGKGEILVLLSLQ